MHYCWCAALITTVVLLFNKYVESSRVFYPVEVGQSCTTHLNTPGKCERSCGGERASLSEEFVRCGISDSVFLYCCAQNAVRTNENLADISPPLTRFQCGRNSKNRYLFDPFDGVEPQILRPDATKPSRTPEDGTAPSARPGIPESLSYDDDDVTLPPNTHAAVGGIVAEKNAWPWMALIGSKSAPDNHWFCGGVLINEQWVLSALHCFLHNTAQVVRLGEHDYGTAHEGSTHRDFDVVQTVLYPFYNHPQAYHDLALLKLSPTVIIDKFMRPVCLPWGKESDSVLTNQVATLTGWGDTEYRGFPSTILQEVNVTVFSDEQCDNNYSGLPHYAATWPQGIGKETLCAGDPNGGRDACQGDSGGPLVSQNAQGVYVLAGIISRGYGCGHKDYPGLYVNVRHHPYLDWIKQIAFSPTS